jgi:integral membrane protein
MNPLTFLRIFSILDGISFLYLLFHSIYSKRIMGIEEAIRIPGMIHGAIFCLFAVALYLTWDKLKWPLKRAAFVFLCALIPFAPFFLEASLKKEQKGLS